MGHELQKSCLLFLFLHSSVVQSFSLRSCRVSLNVAICSDAGLTSVPSDIPPTVEGIDLSKNNIPKLRTTHFQNFTTLATLTLAFNKITSIEKGTFSQLISLKKLVLRQNQLTKLPDGVFDGLSSVTELRISYNHITNISRDAFKPLKKLHTLDFSGNKACTLQQISLILQHTPYLSDLSIRSVRMSSFKSSELSNKSTALRLLNISNNPLTFFQITTNIFPNLTRINIGNPPQKLNLKWDVPDKSVISEVDTLDISGIRMNPSQKLWDFLSVFSSSLETLILDSMHNNTRTLIDKACSIPTVSELQFRNNYWPVIDYGLLSMCTNVTTMDLSRCTIKKITNGSFAGLSGLQTLILAHNKFSAVPYALKDVCSLSKLDLSNNSIEALECSDFANLTNLRHLSLQWNQIATLRKCVFQNLSKLNDLQLQGNLLTTLNNAFHPSLPSLKTLSLFNNSLTILKAGEFRGLTSLQKLSLHSNQILSLQKSCFYGLKNLHNLLLGENKLQSKSLDLDCFKDLINLRNLNLGQNQIKFSDSTNLKRPPFSNLSKLERLDFRSQRFRLRGSIPSNFLQGLSNLTLLDFGNIKITDISDDFFIHTPNLDSLDLSANDLMDFSPELFSPIPKLRELRLTSTNLRSLDFLIQSNLTKLEFLQARKNGFFLMTEDIIKSVPSLSYLDLKYNSFKCDCESSAFIHWVKTSNQTQVFDAHSFQCFYPRQQKGTKLLDVNLQLCVIDIGLICFKFFTSFILAFMIAAFVFHFMRFQIAYAYYIFTAWLFDGRNRNRKAPIQYDAFVSYNVHDENWVYRELVSHLEKEQGWKLCLHHRDFEPGRPIVDNITDAIYGSRKTLCVISRSYLRSEWCSREMQVASFRLFDERRDVLILVFLEDIPSAHMSPYYRMRKVLRRQTYLSWPGIGPEAQVFWEKLRRALTSSKSQTEERLLLTVTDEQGT